HAEASPVVMDVRPHHPAEAVAQAMDQMPLAAGRLLAGLAGKAQTVADIADGPAPPGRGGEIVEAVAGLDTAGHRRAMTLRKRGHDGRPTPISANSSRASPTSRQVRQRIAAKAPAL